MQIQMLGWEARCVDKEGEKDRNRLSQIDDVKWVVKTIAGVADKTYGVINAAPAQLLNAGNKIEELGAKRRASRWWP